MATAYIDVSPEEDQALSLVQFVNQARTKGKEPDPSFVESCTKLIKDKHFAELWSLLMTESPVLFVDSQEKEIEGFYAVVASLLKRLGVPAIRQVVPKLLAAVSSNGEDKALLRMRILGNTYNILDVDNAVRYEIFVGIMNYAAISKHPEIVAPHFKSVEKRVLEWGLDNKQIKQLYQKIRDVYKTHKKTADAYRWSVKYLSSFEKGDAEAVSEAVNVAVEAITLPDLYQFDDLLEIEAVKALEKDSKNSKMYQLLTIFISESLESFKSFVTSNPDFLKSHGMDQTNLMRKMKFLTLATLASNQREIPYATISKSLQISEEEVETMVVEAIGEGILEAKLDQIRSVVIVTRSLQRIFTRVQWKQLGDNLESWKKNVQLLLSTLHDCKSQSQQHALDLLKDTDTDISQI